MSFNNNNKKKIYIYIYIWQCGRWTIYVRKYMAYACNLTIRWGIWRGVHMHFMFQHHSWPSCCWTIQHKVTDLECQVMLLVFAVISIVVIKP